MKTYILSCLLFFAVQVSADSLHQEGLIPSSEPGWPQWRGPYRDGISYETGLLQSWPEQGPELLWKTEPIGYGWSSPIVVNGMVYITGDIEEDLKIFAYDTDGNLKWQTTNGRAWKKSYHGARACCAYSDGCIYNMNAHGRVACIDAKTGDEIWSVNILERFEGKNITWAMSECLLIDGGNLIVTPVGKKAMVAALDRKNGQTLWATDPLEGDKLTHSSPIIFEHAGKRLISNCTSAHGFGIDADTGELMWTVPLENKYGTNISTPVYGMSKIYYVTPYSEMGRCYFLLPEKGRFRPVHLWTNPLDTVTGCGVLVDEVFYSSGYKDVKWWCAVDWLTGRNKCELKTLTTGSAIYADKRLYILDEKGTLALVEPKSDSLEIRGSFKVVEKTRNDAWAHPVLLDGKLYVRYHDTLWCYDVREK